MHRYLYKYWVTVPILGLSTLLVLPCNTLNYFVIPADTTTPIPVVYACMHENFVKVVFCTAVQLHLEKHAENCCSNHRTSVEMVSVSTEMKVLVLDSLFKRVALVHPCHGWYQVTGNHQPNRHGAAVGVLLLCQST